MSTKIYTGFVLNTTDFHEANALINEFRGSLRIAQRTSVINQFAHQCAELYDRHTVDKTSDPHSIFGRVWNNFTTAQEKVRVEQVKDPSVDFSFSIVLFPFEGKFYGMFFTVQTDFARRWLDKPEVSEYGYWNNVDEPEGMGAEEWKERGRVWDGIMGDTPIPSLIGITYEVTQESLYDLPTLGEVVAAIPDLNARALTTAKDTLYREFVANREINSTNVMKVFRKFVEYINSSEGSAKLELERQGMLTELRLVVDEKCLSGNKPVPKPKLELVV